MATAPLEPTERLLTAHEVAEILALKVSSIYDAVNKGRLPAVRLWEGRRRAVIRFRAADIQRLIDERSRPATSRASGTSSRES